MLHSNRTIVYKIVQISQILSREKYIYFSNLWRIANSFFHWLSSFFMWHQCLQSEHHPLGRAANPNDYKGLLYLGNIGNVHRSPMHLKFPLLLNGGHHHVCTFDHELKKYFGHEMWKYFSHELWPQVEPVVKLLTTNLRSGVQGLANNVLGSTGK